MTKTEKINGLLDDIESDITSAEMRLSDCESAINDIRLLLGEDAVEINGKCIKEEERMKVLCDELRAMGR